ncbi:MAG: ABC-2 family transporter protein [Myxococcota bacterium]
MTTAARVLRAIPGLLRLGFAESVAYRAEFVIWFLSTTLPLVMLALWLAAAENSTVGPFDEAGFVAYYVAVLVVRQLSGSWVVWTLNEEIRHGTLSVRLLRPLHPLWLYAAENLAALPLRLCVLVPLVAAAAWWRGGLAISTAPEHVLVFLLTSFGAWLLAFTIQVLIGLLALWSDQSLSLWDVFFGLWAICSGYLIPLELTPAWMHTASYVLPFRSMLSLPVEIILGHLSPSEIAQGVAVQWLWIILLGTVTLRLWRSGIRRYEAYGA